MSCQNGHTVFVLSHFGGLAYNLSGGVVRLLRLLSQLGMTLYMLYHVLVLLVEGWYMVVEVEAVALGVHSLDLTKVN
jgi:hypothetical protein